MNRAIIYARVSKDQSAKTGYSIPTQIEACQKYASQHGFTVIDTITDDITGALPVIDRPGGARVYEYINQRSIDAVIMFTIDRTARDDREYPLEFMLFLRDVQDAGAELHFVDSGLSTGGLLDLFQAWRAAEERRKIVERTTRGKRASARAGNVLINGHRPYGYNPCLTVDGKRSLEPNEIEAEIVRMIFRWYIHEDVGGEIIAGRLTKLGVQTPRRAGTGWSKRTVLFILKNPIYTGISRYGKISNPQTRGILPLSAPIDVQIPAIIDQETFDAAQERLKRNRCNGLRPKSFFLLRERVFCGQCGTPMRCVADKGVNVPQRHYVCGVQRSKHDYNRLGRRCDLKNYFSARQVDDTVWREVSSWLTDPECLMRAITAHKKTLDENAEPILQRLAGIERLIEQNQSKIERILELYLEGEFTKEMLQVHKVQAETAIASLAAERQLAMAEIEAQTMTDEHLQNIKSLLTAIRERLPYGDECIEARADVIAALGIEARLYLKDGEQWVKLTSYAASKDIPIRVQQYKDNCTRRGILFSIDMLVHRFGASNG